MGDGDRRVDVGRAGLTVLSLDESGEGLGEERAEVGEKLEETLVWAGADTLGKHGARKRVEVAGGGLGDPETGGSTSNMVGLALESRDGEVDDVTAHATSMRGRTPRRDAERLDAGRGETCSRRGAEVLQESTRAQIFDLEIGERVLAVLLRSRGSLCRGFDGFRCRRSSGLLARLGLLALASLLSCTVQRVSNVFCRPATACCDESRTLFGLLNNNRLLG